MTCSKKILKREGRKIIRNNTEGLAKRPALFICRVTSCHDTFGSLVRSGPVFQEAAAAGRLRGIPVTDAFSEGNAPLAGYAVSSHRMHFQEAMRTRSHDILTPDAFSGSNAHPVGHTISWRRDAFSGKHYTHPLPEDNAVIFSAPPPPKSRSLGKKM